MSMEQERAIAQKYIGGFPWLMVIWGLGGLAIWVALFPLAHLGYIPIWLATLIAIITMSYCYLPSHEAQHGNIGRPGTRWRWLSELVGHLSIAPWIFPYRLHRAIHLKHHANTNDNYKDPDIHMRADNVWQAAYKAWLGQQPGRNSGLQEDVLDDNPQRDELMWEAFLCGCASWLLVAVACWSGFALEVLMIWWIPRVISRIYTPVTLSWAPHHPMLEKGRYRDTRGNHLVIGNGVPPGASSVPIHTPQQDTGRLSRTQTAAGNRGRGLRRFVSR